MDRMTRHYRYVAGMLALAVVLSTAGGCRGLLTTVAYLIKGTEVEPEYLGLKGKKVVVVCRPSASLLMGNYPTVGDELARQVGTLLRTNVSKIQIVDHQKLSEWTDEHDWMDYPEVGNAMKADMVVGIDLLEFSLLRGQTLYQGAANVSLAVYDCKNGGREVYQKHMPQTLWPPNSSIPSTDRQEPQFRREFVRELADQIGRHFYPHDKQMDFARDADAL